MSFDVILQKIKEQKQVAEQDLSTVSARALPYKKGQVTAAKERLEGLYIDYKNEVLRNSIFILVTGSLNKKFSDIAEKKFKCFKINGKDFYEEILEKISPSLYQDKKINASTFEVIGNVLEDKMKSFDVLSYPQLMFDSKYCRVIKNKKEMLDVTVSAINEIVGGEVIGLDALEKVTKDAVNKEYKSKIVPILIYSDDENFVDKTSNDLRKLNPRVVRISAGKTKKDINPLFSLEKVTEETVKNTLKDIANKS